MPTPPAAWVPVLAPPFSASSRRLPSTVSANTWCHQRSTTLSCNSGYTLVADSVVGVHCNACCSFLQVKTLGKRASRQPTGQPGGGVRAGGRRAARACGWAAAAQLRGLDWCRGESGGGGGYGISAGAIRGRRRYSTQRGEERDHSRVGRRNWTRPLMRPTVRTNPPGIPHAQTTHLSLCHLNPTTCCLCCLCIAFGVCVRQSESAWNHQLHGSACSLGVRMYIE